MEGEYPHVDREHHVRPRRAEAAVDPILLGVGDAVEKKVHHHLAQLYFFRFFILVFFFFMGEGGGGVFFN